MGEQKTDLLRGTLDLLILKTLTLEPMHGLGISRRLDQITEGVFQVRPGSLFPALHPGHVGRCSRRANWPHRSRSGGR